MRKTADQYIEARTMPYRALPITLPPRRKPKRHIPRYMICMAICQLFYAGVSISIAALAYYYLVSQPVYRVVSLVVIAIIWSNAASITARRKPIDMVETTKVTAIRAKYTDSTNVFLKAIKASF